MSDTPITDAEQEKQHESYERWREAGWPAFAVDFDFARRMERKLIEHEAMLRDLIQECEYSAATGLPFNGKWVQFEKAKTMLAKWQENNF